MKKNYIIALSLLLITVFITGCGAKGNSGTKTCTKTETDDDGYKTTETMKVTYKNDKVTVVESSNVSESDPQVIDFVMNIGSAFANKLNEADGIEASYSKEDNNKIKMYIKVEFDKVNIDNLKSKLGDLYKEDNTFYSKKDITIDEFTKEYLSDYTCN